MATSLLAAKSFPGIRVYTPGDPKMPKNPINFGLTRKSPRCAQCLKFQANDPSKVREDEVKGKLQRCSTCKIVKYCSRNCQKNNYQFHKNHCQSLKLIGTTELPPIHHAMGLECLQNWAHMQFYKATSLYATAIMGQDYGLCEDFLEFAIKIQKLWNGFDKRLLENDSNNDIKNGQNFIEKFVDMLCVSVLLTLGRDQEVYDFMKLQHCWFCPKHFRKNTTSYETFKNLPKNREESGRSKENFSNEKFFQWFLEKQNRLKNRRWILVTLEAEAWLTLAIIKINIIGEMKEKWSKMNNFFQKYKYRKKFRRSKKILEGLSIMKIGTDENSFKEELQIQEEQLKKLLTLMMKSFNGHELWPIWLAIDGDCRDHFIENYQKEENYQKIDTSGLFGLIKYFDHHQTAGKIILEYMKNKKGFKVEKNFYVNLMELPQKSHFFINDGSLFCEHNKPSECDCCKIKEKRN